MAVSFGVPFGFKYRYMMNIRLLFFCFVCFFLLERGYGQVKSSDVPVIRLCPEEAQTLKMSELFTGYRVMSLKGCSYTWVKNILELDDRFIALFEISLGNNYIAEFVKSGNFKRKIGSNDDCDKYHYVHDIFFESNGTLGAYASSNPEYLNYSLEGKLNYRRAIKNTTGIWDEDFALKGRVGNDLYLWCRRYRQGKNYSESYWLKVMTTDGRLVRQFFPLKGLKNRGKDSFYRYGSAIRLYNVYDSYIYSVEGDQIRPSYYVDKGQHSVLLDFELWFKDEEKANREAGVHHITVNENRKYVMGSYFFKERYYYFVHDKSNGKTCNYVSIDDDILFSLSFPIKYFPSVYFDSWNNFDDHYIYFYYRPRAFIRKVDRLKEHLLPSAWDEFCRKHPDIIKIYQENDRDAFVIISYKFR